MLKSETAMLVAFVASLEGREPNELQVESWHEIIGHLDYEEAKEAAREHFRTESRRFYPADLVTTIRTSDQQDAIDYEVKGARISESMWSNAIVLPREIIRALGEIHAEGNPGAFQGLVSQLEVDFDLTRRLKAVN